MGASLQQRSQYDQGFRAQRRRSANELIARLRECLGADWCDTLLEEGWQLAPEAAIEMGLTLLQE